MMSAACGSWPATRVSLSCPFVDDILVTTDVHDLVTVSLHRSHELDFAVMVPLPVPVHKRGSAFAGGLLTGERPAGVDRQLFCRAKQGLYVGYLLDTCGLGKDLSTPSSSSRFSAWPRASRCGHDPLPDVNPEASHIKMLGH
jgi:hypothetical protein